jgi:hypothetical protein
MRSAHASSSTKSLRAAAFMLWCAANFPHLESAVGQTEKNSVRAYVFRFAPELGHCSAQSACLKGAINGHATCKSSEKQPCSDL